MLGEIGLFLFLRLVPYGGVALLAIISVVVGGALYALATGRLKVRLGGLRMLRNVVAIVLGFALLGVVLALFAR